MKGAKAISPMITAILVIAALLLGFGQANAADPVTLKFSVMHGTKGGKYINGLKPWAEKIEKDAGGALKIQIFPSNSLATARENYDATINGLVDIGFIALTHYPGRFPLADLLTLPGPVLPNAKVASRMVWALYEKYPGFQKHFKQVKMLILWGYAPINICTVDRPVRKIEDLRGLRVRFAGKGGSVLLKKAGASPVAMPPSDMFLALQKGVIKGSVIGWEGQRSFGATKMCKYYTDAPVIPGPYFAIFMNKRKWASLPQAAKDAITKHSGKAGMEFFGDGDIKNTALGVGEAKASGGQFFELSETDMQRMGALAEPFVKKAIKKVAKKGLPAQAFYDDMMRLSKELNK